MQKSGHHAKHYVNFEAGFVSFSTI